MSRPSMSVAIPIPGSARPSNNIDEDGQFVGTPYDTQQPFEYPFPPTIVGSTSGYYSNHARGASAHIPTVLTSPLPPDPHPNPHHQAKGPQRPPYHIPQSNITLKPNHVSQSLATSSSSSLVSSSSSSNSNSSHYSPPRHSSSRSSSTSSTSSSEGSSSSRGAATRAAGLAARRPKMAGMSLNLSEAPIPPGLLGKDLGALSPVLGLSPGEPVTPENLGRRHKISLMRTPGGSIVNGHSMSRAGPR